MPNRKNRRSIQVSQNVLYTISVIQFRDVFRNSLLSTNSSDKVVSFFIILEGVAALLLKPEISAVTKLPVGLLKEKLDFAIKNYICLDRAYFYPCEII